ncbi:hypothetical protein IGI04_029770 [Brassica rapa subsp. trilocularis]|uniref:RNase H type-1 domain-containing protein n=1 Tax=Brassica rapa subsp. trilocularis TaxID=1813537 RepID=A0ABQ7LS08_BRACM|nr:hypothetical protein IGI04_029770 [Brassica rapa subsp. trilocularis]
MEESSELKTILGNYEASSRQTINFSKSSINVGSLRPQRKEYCFPPLLENVCGVISGKPRHLQNSATSYEGVSGALAVKERLKFHCINLDATCDVNYQETPSINHAAVTPSTNPAVVRPSTHTSVWHKPRQGDLKCNVASFWILYNHHGETLLSSRRTCTKLGYEVHVALLNLHWAIKSMMHLHFHRIIIEFSLTALRDVLSSPEFYPQYHNLFDDLQYMLKCIDY